MTFHRNISPVRRVQCKGNALVLFIIIVVLAISAVLFLQSTGKEPTGPVEQFPWTETGRIVGDAAMIILPHPPQFNLQEETLKRYSIVSDEGENRGRLEIIIGPTGAVLAAWTANYKEDVYEKEFSATCAGNVDAGMLYADENGTSDPSKLFFITEGRFILQAFKHGNATLGGGEAYVVGWMNPDGSASGTLVLTPDKKTVKISTVPLKLFA